MSTNQKAAPLGVPVPILTYHSLDGGGSVVSVAPEVFRRQMMALRGWGFRGVRLVDLIDARRGGEPLGGRPVVLTFDDGFQNVLEHAVPILVELGFRATIFAVSGYCGASNDWPGQPPEIPRLPLLTRSQLRGLADASFEVGAHGMSHAPLTRITPELARGEVEGSKQALEDVLGREVATFAYPYGLANRAVEALAEGSYRGACGVEMGWSGPDDPLHRLSRIDAYYLRARTAFRAFPTPIGRAYLGLRAIGRACRARLLAGSLGTT